MTATRRRPEPYYPESDGKPFAETEFHFDVMAYLIHALQVRYADEPDVYVSGNLLFYYVEGDPKASISPDVFLVRGIPKGPRMNYLLWKEGKAPDLVIEVTSDSTCQEDLEKKERYEALGVTEHFLFDPLDDYLDPRLQGYRLKRGRYQPIPLERDGSLRSQTTGLILRPEGMNLRLIDAVTGERLLGRREEAAARQAAEERTRALEDEIARLRRELGRD